MDEISVNRELDICNILGIEPTAAKGDTLQVEIVSLKYQDQLNCSEVHEVRIVATTSGSLQHWVGLQMSGGYAAIDDLGYVLMGGDHPPLPPDHPGSVWRWAVVGKDCDGVNERFNPVEPKLGFGFLHTTSSGRNCAEAWTATLTRIEE